MDRRLVVLPAVAAILLAAAACGGPPADTSGPVATTITAVQPCALISDDVAQGNDLDSQGPGTTSAARTCHWQNATADDGRGYLLSVDVRDRQGIQDIDATGVTVTDDPVGQHDGRQLKDTTGRSCTVVVGVTATARVDVVVTAGNVGESCDLAGRFAHDVAPRLP